MMGLDSNAKSLTLEQMREEIRAGRGILHDGEVITDEARLPNAAKLAAGDPVAIQKARANVAARKKALDDEQAELDRIEAKAETEAAAKKKADEEARLAAEAEAAKKKAETSKGK